MRYSAISRSALLDDYTSEKNDVVPCRDEIWSLKNNVGTMREHYVSALTRITEKILLKHCTDGSGQLLNPELVAFLEESHRGFCFTELFGDVSKLRVILTGTPRGCF